MPERGNYMVSEPMGHKASQEEKTNWGKCLGLQLGM